MTAKSVLLRPGRVPPLALLCYATEIHFLQCFVSIVNVSASSAEGLEFKS